MINAAKKVIVIFSSRASEQHSSILGVGVGGRVLHLHQVAIPLRCPFRLLGLGCHDLQNYSTHGWVTHVECNR